MVNISGQRLAPVIDVDGKILADFGPEELAKFWETLPKSTSVGSRNKACNENCRSVA